MIFTFDTGNYPYLFFWDILDISEETDKTVEDAFFTIDSIRLN